MWKKQQHQQSEKWLKEFKNILHRSFKKVRIGRGKAQRNDIVEKIKVKHQLQNDLEKITSDMKNENVSIEAIMKKHEYEDKIEDLEEAIAEATAEKHSAIIIEHFKDLSGDNGELSVAKMWKLKKKLSPQTSEVPMAMLDPCGNLISGKYGLKKLYETTYKERLSHKPIKSDWEDIQILKESLFESRIKLSSQQKSDDWDLANVKKICKKLKAGKARDRDDLIFELFKPDFAGEDLFESLKLMFNGLRRNLSIPDFLQNVSITSLYKNKGRKNEFSNQRGIFNVSKVRYILDKMVYEDVYPIIENELSYSNIGGRKGRNIRDYLP